jgi:LysR family transcriptional regulator, glycine cleavage system transcriptional activator
MLRFPPFAPLKAFFAAAESSEAGRLRAAAKQLGLTESAVSHQVKGLEHFLGVALFERNGRALRLTPAGMRFHRAIQPALSAIQAATDDMKAEPRRQRVTLSLPTSIAAFWLIPRMARLQQAHPGIDLQLVATNRLC